MELGPTTLFLLVVLFAGAAAVMLITMGKWLDLTGFRYKMDTQRNAMNLVQLIVSNSPVVKKTTDEPDKLILDAEILEDYESNAGIGEESMTPQRENWEECCDFLDFDHNFTVHDTVTDNDWTIGNLVFETDSDCYPERVQGFADLPIVVSDNDENHPGVAIVRLSKTPLSEMSFWLSQAFMRAHWDEYWNLFPNQDEYTVYVPLDGEIRKVSFHPSVGSPERICTHIDKTGDGIPDIFVCKNLVSKTRTTNGNPISWDPDPCLVYDDCMMVSITVKKSPRKVIIVYPNPEEC